ncbi:hypothetical protein E4G67_00260 [Candidatus Bathyarchaeota archaeon]|nr:MAG: hypothetical protein E4G67_00260 [Candidatus Bathyarchaeota archaeon]
MRKNRRNQIRVSPQQQAMLRLTASPNRDVAYAAQRAMAAALSEPLRQGIFDEDNLGAVYRKDMLAPGAQSNYPLDFVRPGTEDLDFTAITLPKQGRVPERHVEGDELWVPTFQIANSIDWSLRYARDARFDVVGRALRVYQMGYTRKINEDGWHTLLAAADARGLVVNDAAAQAGQLTKELVSKMQTAMTRNAGGNGQAGKLTDLHMSLEAMEDIRAYDLSEIDDLTRKDILNSTPDGLASFYGTTLHFMTEFGVGQEYQLYLATILGRSVVAVDATDEEFVVGLDLSTNDSFVQPVRQELMTFEAGPEMHRQQRAGVYGWMEHGYAVLDNRRVILGTF